MKQKSETKDIIIALIKELKQAYDINVKNIRCNNSGENNALQRICKQEGLGIAFKYTAPVTPQQNVESRDDSQLCMVESELCCKTLVATSTIRGCGPKRLILQQTLIIC